MGQTGWLFTWLLLSWGQTGWLFTWLLLSWVRLLALHCQQLTWTLKEPSETCRLHMISTVNTGMLYHERLRLLYRF
ncbi:hypothetical protein DPMN_074946 [Dreissena polymorpha]|uniref:Uncharacterized protein n=1 Tax=Dreissena polymorpha TaxID=45954 RepID=A0A9D3YJJ2_DREPO|nr:hypothetical protein DPMN_074946 [Dreissena polymorpha]